MIAMRLPLLADSGWSVFDATVTVAVAAAMTVAAAAAAGAGPLTRVYLIALDTS